MKKNILILLTLYFSLFTVHCSFSQQYGWIDLGVNIPDSSANLNDVYAIGQEVWIANGNNPDPTAIIYHSSDGGLSFNSQYVPANSGIGMSIAMRSPQEGYVVTNTGRLLSTTNGGNNWSTAGTGLGLLYSISFPPLPDTSGYICGGFGGKICRVTGSTVTIELTTPVTLTSIVFPVNSTEGWVCGETIIRHRDINGWHADQYYDNGFYYNAIHFVDNLHGWAVAVEGKIIHTTNGQNWIPQANADNNQLMDVFFLNTQEGWAVGDHVILHTTDGGTNWMEEDESMTDSISFVSVFAVNSHEVYVAGQKYFGTGKYHPVLLKYTEITGMDEPKIPEAILLQNQPNPVNQSTVFTWRLGIGCPVVLKVYDFLGREVKTLVDEVMSPGEHHVNYDASGLTPGVYFSQIRVNGIAETKKIIKLK